MKKNRRERYIPLWVRNYFQWRQRWYGVSALLTAVIVIMAIFLTATHDGLLVRSLGFAAAGAVLYTATAPLFQRRADAWVGKRLRLVLGCGLSEGFPCWPHPDEPLAIWAWIIHLSPGKASWGITRNYHEGRELIELLEDNERPEERLLNKQDLMRRHPIASIQNSCFGYPHSSIFNKLVAAVGEQRQAA